MCVCARLKGAVGCVQYSMECFFHDNQQACRLTLSTCQLLLLKGHSQKKIPTCRTDTSLNVALSIDSSLNNLVFWPTEGINNLINFMLSNIQMRHGNHTSTAIL